MYSRSWFCSAGKVKTPCYRCDMPWTLSVQMYSVCYFKPVLFNSTDCKSYGDVTGPSLLQEDSLGGTLGNCFVLHGMTRLRVAWFVTFLVLWSDVCEFVIFLLSQRALTLYLQSVPLLPAMSPPPLERELDLQISNHRELRESLWQELGSVLALLVLIILWYS